jgi:hypothetical protein
MQKGSRSRKASLLSRKSFTAEKRPTLNYVEFENIILKHHTERFLSQSPFLNGLIESNGTKRTKFDSLAQSLGSCHAERNVTV